MNVAFPGSTSSVISAVFPPSTSPPSSSFQEEFKHYVQRLETSGQEELLLEIYLEANLKGEAATLLKKLLRRDPSNNKFKLAQLKLDLALGIVTDHAFYCAEVLLATLQNADYLPYWNHLGEINACNIETRSPYFPNAVAAAVTFAANHSDDTDKKMLEAMREVDNKPSMELTLYYLKYLSMASKPCPDWLKPHVNKISFDAASKNVELFETLLLYYYEEGRIQELDLWIARYLEEITPWSQTVKRFYLVRLLERKDFDRANQTTLLNCSPELGFVKHFSQHTQSMQKLLLQFLLKPKHGFIWDACRREAFRASQWEELEVSLNVLLAHFCSLRNPHTLMWKAELAYVSFKLNKERWADYFKCLLQVHPCISVFVTGVMISCDGEDYDGAEKYIKLAYAGTNPTKLDLTKRCGALLYLLLCSTKGHSFIPRALKEISTYIEENPFEIDTKIIRMTFLIRLEGTNLYDEDLLIADAQEVYRHDFTQVFPREVLAAWHIKKSEKATDGEKTNELREALNLLEPIKPRSEKTKFLLAKICIILEQYKKGLGLLESIKSPLPELNPMDVDKLKSECRKHIPETTTKVTSVSAAIPQAQDAPESPKKLFSDNPSLPDEFLPYQNGLWRSEDYKMLYELFLDSGLTGRARFFLKKVLETNPDNIKHQLADIKFLVDAHDHSVPGSTDTLHEKIILFAYANLGYLPAWNYLGEFIGAYLQGVEVTFSSNLTKGLVFGACNHPDAENALKQALKEAGATPPMELLLYYVKFLSKHGKEYPEDLINLSNDLQFEQVSQDLEMFGLMLLYLYETEQFEKLDSWLARYSTEVSPWSQTVRRFQQARMIDRKDLEGLDCLPLLNNPFYPTTPSTLIHDHPELKALYHLSLLKPFSEIWSKEANKFVKSEQWIIQEFILSTLTSLYSPWEIASGNITYYEWKAHLAFTESKLEKSCWVDTIQIALSHTPSLSVLAIATILYCDANRMDLSEINLRGAFALTDLTDDGIYKRCYALNYALRRSTAGTEFLPQAMVEISRFIMNSPSNIAARRLRINFNLELRKTSHHNEKTLHEDAQKVHEDTPNESLSREILAQMHFARSEYPRVKELLDPISPTAPNALILMAHTEIALGHFPEARHAIKRLRNLKPTIDPLALKNLEHLCQTAEADFLSKPTQTAAPAAVKAKKGRSRRVNVTAAKATAASTASADSPTPMPPLIDLNLNLSSVARQSNVEATASPLVRKTAPLRLRVFNRIEILKRLEISPEIISAQELFKYVAEIYGRNQLLLAAKINHRVKVLCQGARKSPVNPPLTRLTLSFPSSTVPSAASSILRAPTPLPTQERQIRLLHLNVEPHSQDQMLLVDLFRNTVEEIVSSAKAMRVDSKK